jgi:uncharacterized protein YgiB involved in biofilm formation
MHAKKKVSANRHTQKSSRSVKLVLIGAAALSTALIAGCGKNNDIRRDVYANKEDCLADWGNTPQDCEPAYNHPSSRGATTAYYGRPYSYHGGMSSPSRSGKTIGTSSSSVSRSGFGSSARSSSS